MGSVGLDRRTGRVSRDWAHVVQSIEDILSTRVLTRLMRRPYGSDVPKLIDAPMNDATLLAVYVAIAEALTAWEPRYELQLVTFAAVGPSGRAEIALVGVYFPDGHKGDRRPDNGEERAVSIVQMSETMWRAAA